MSDCGISTGCFDCYGGLNVFLICGKVNYFIMHIVYVCREYPPSLRGGGIASYIKEIAHGMCRAGHQVTVVAASDDTRREYEEMDGDVRVFRLKGGDFVIPSIEPGCRLLKLRELYRFRSYRKRIRDVIKTLDAVDIIEVAEFGAEGLCLDGLGIPVVVRLHTPSLFDRNTQKIINFSLDNCFRYWQQKKELSIVRKAKYITSCSDNLRQWFYKNVEGINHRIKVIYNPVDVSLSENDDELKENKHPFILFAGTIVEMKGIEDLIKACIIIHNQGYNHDLIIAGKEGAFADYLKNVYSDYGWIHFVGKLSKKQLYQNYRKADLVCLPSWWDNLPMVCLEAMMNKAIVVASNEGGMSEIIRDGVDGFLIKPKSPELLAKLMVKILSDDAKDRVKEVAHQRIKSTFDTKVIVGEMERYYRETIHDFKGINL